MKKPAYIPLFMVLLLFKSIAACTEPIDLTSNAAAPTLAIVCILSTDTTTYSVTVQRSVPFFAYEFPTWVHDAKVYLDSELLPNVNKEYYATRPDFYGVPGQTYTLEVRYDLDGDGIEEVYTATTTIPTVRYQVDSITLSSIMMFPKKDFPAWLVLHFQDSIGWDYFGAHLYVNNPNYSYARHFHNGYYSNRLLRYSLFSFDILPHEGTDRTLTADWWINKEMMRDNDKVWKIYCGDTLTVELQTLSKEYYEYMSLVKLELSQNNPLFSGPRSNVPTNFTGGAIGFFGSYTSSRASIVLPMDSPYLYPYPPPPGPRENTPR